ncbi:hypothetical protein BA896_019550 [Janthinobacterium lividum]|uniref:RapA2 cadherin-like domain-containing protein n=1 Tax=Janthinobacterium lividum TaxID=29581 RepID=A0A1E8PMH5_9BURK|nr:hypothetical protein BA896_019550 [Janthinobacterium lividum]
MTTYNLSTTVHVCEDINKNFDIRDLLTQAGYAVQGELNIKNFTVLLPDDTESTSNTPLFGMLDADTVYVRPGDWAANYNGNFSTIQVTIDKGNGDIVQLELQVIIDPVNDAPDAADKTFNLVDGSSVVLSEGDFGFTTMWNTTTSSPCSLPTRPLPARYCSMAWRSRWARKFPSTTSAQATWSLCQARRSPAISTWASRCVTMAALPAATRKT